MLGLLCMWPVPFLLLLHVVIEPGGPYQEAGAKLLGPTGHQNYEPLYKRHGLRYSLKEVLNRPKQLLSDSNVSGG